jgi:hypothetical protein
LEADVGKPLLDVLRDVVLDPAEQAAFTADPATYLSQYGYDDVDTDDLSEAFGLVADTLPPDVAQAVADAAPSPVPVPYPSESIDGDDAFAVGEGDGATFGDVNGDFDAVALGGPDTTPGVDDADADADEHGVTFDADEHGVTFDADEHGIAFDAEGQAPPEGDQPPPEGDRPVGFGEGSVDGDDALGGPDTSPDGFGDVRAEPDWSADVDADADDGDPGDGFAGDALGGPDTYPEEVVETDDYGDRAHDDVDDVDDLDDLDTGIGDDPGDFLDDVGSF